jgi:hypothetical protein
LAADWLSHVVFAWDYLDSKLKRGFDMSFNDNEDELEDTVKLPSKPMNRRKDLSRAQLREEQVVKLKTQRRGLVRPKTNQGK